MNNPSLLRTVAWGGLLGLALGASQSVWASPSIFLTTSDPLAYDRAHTGQTLTVDVRVRLGATDTADQILTYIGVFMAYDPNVLKYRDGSVVFGPAMDITGASPVPAFGYAANPVNYLDPDNNGGIGWTLDPSIPASYKIGTPDLTTADFSPLIGDPFGIPTGYVDGSLLNILSVDKATLSAAEQAQLLAKQQDSLGAVLYSVTFDVITSNIASSSIILIDEANYTTNPTGDSYDYKLYGSGASLNNPYYSPTVPSLQVQVPVPAPLVLMAAGLLGMGLQRWRLGRLQS